jgi:hypothetical protein
MKDVGVGVGSRRKEITSQLRFLILNNEKQV